MEWLSRYWPSLVGIPLVVFVAIKVWPKDEPEFVETAPVGVSQPAEVEVFKSPDIRGEQAPERLAERKAIRERTGSKSRPRTELRAKQVLVRTEAKKPEPVTLTGDDPRVKAALRSIYITLFVRDDCFPCEEAQRYFSANGLRVSVRNVTTDDMAQNRARQLGASSTPSVVIDGKSIGRFSPGAVQAALNRAAKERVEAQIAK